MKVKMKTKKSYSAGCWGSRRLVAVDSMFVEKRALAEHKNCSTTTLINFPPSSITTHAPTQSEQSNQLLELACLHTSSPVLQLRKVRISQIRLHLQMIHPPFQEPTPLTHRLRIAHDAKMSLRPRHRNCIPVRNQHSRPTHNLIPSPKSYTESIKEQNKPFNLLLSPKHPTSPPSLLLTKLTTTASFSLP